MLLTNKIDCKIMLLFSVYHEAKMGESAKIPNKNSVVGNIAPEMSHDIPWSKTAHVDFWISLIATITPEGYT